MLPVEFEPEIPASKQPQPMPYAVWQLGLALQVTHKSYFRKVVCAYYNASHLCNLM